MQPAAGPSLRPNIAKYESAGTLAAAPGRRGHQFDADGTGGLQHPFSHFHQAKGRQRDVDIINPMCDREPATERVGRSLLGSLICPQRTG